MLRETKTLEEARFGVENQPFLAKNIRVGDDGFAITGDHVARSESAHDANTLGKVLSLSLRKRDGHKVLVGLYLDALAPVQINFKDMLLVGGLHMQELKPAECDRQVSAASASHTVEVVVSLTFEFENICTNTEHGTGDVRHVATISSKARLHADFALKRFMSFHDHKKSSVFFVKKSPSIKLGIYIKSRQDHTTNLGLFAVPYLERNCPAGYIVFGLLDRPNLHKLFSHSKQLFPSEHNEMVKRLQTAEIKLHAFDLRDHPAGVRFCTVDDTEFTKLGNGEKKLPNHEPFQFLPSLPGMADSGIFMLKSFVGGNEKLPCNAVALSFWNSWPFQLPPVDNRTCEG
jgi:hypothetical protein